MQRVKPSIQIRGEFCIELRPQPCGMIIFGASGDLTSRKLIPSLYHLYQRKLLSKNFYIVGCARSSYTDDSFRNHLSEAMTEAGPVDPVTLGEFLGLCYYQAGDYGDEHFYQTLAGRLNGLDADHKTGGNHLFYLSVPPNLYAPVVDCLGQAGLVHENSNTSIEASALGGAQWARVVVEKPLGRDLESARALDRALHQVLTERQIYRIDHYLGKETVQNILMFRFANAIFEPIWDRRYIDHVQITVAETVGVEGRAGYYKQAGALRDMFQNHMLQMLSLVAMEPPASFEADRVRDEKVKLLRSIRPFVSDGLDHCCFIRGQYGPGTVDGKSAPGYRQEKGVDPESMVETYLAGKITIDNWRWEGVPFYLRTGKRLPRKFSEIAVTFGRIPHSMFSPLAPTDFVPNTLVFSVQPDEGIALAIQAKHPGPKLCMSSLTMDFRYNEVFDEEPPEAYERLLLDCMHGDQTLFVRQDDMEISWALLTPVLEHWERYGKGGQLYPYPAGTWGPPEADELIRRDGHQWRKP